ncbi:MAG: lysozyme inhibitor LprI family protein [Elainellaceae cyanobacterium]
MWRRWLLVLLLAGVGCAAPQNSSTADSPGTAADSSAVSASDEARQAETTTIATDRFGPARVGTTLDELKADVTQAFGADVTFVPMPNFMVDLDAIAVNQKDETLFYVLHFSSEPLNDGDIVNLLLTTNSRFQTSDGIGPGTSLSTAEAVYGEATLAHNTDNEMRESVRFADFDVSSLVFRTNGFAAGEDGVGLAGIYGDPVEGSFYETTQYRDDAAIRAVMVDGNQREAARSPLGDVVVVGNENDASVSDGVSTLSYAGADRQLNQTYQTLQGSLDQDGQNRLTTAQRAWIELRDAECAFQPLIRMDKESCLTTVTRDRVIQLDMMLSSEALQVPASLLAGLGTIEVSGTMIDCDNPQGTPPMNYCAALGYEREDDRLNQVYQTIQDGPNTAAKESLIDAQLAWIDFRNAHCLSEVHEASGGTGYNAYYAACQARLTQQRTSALVGYRDFL